eukprot:TRINITY_DN17353_c0_g1_i1.p2 TRINITY_DN17353_c0_g1~~TRINITY_DN17353_c0_g1_i1.p2  ORF type:complete len:168 (-),score=19.63 TRINITY_DN17353_c0_g1_i1:249-752(-)
MWRVVHSSGATGPPTPRNAVPGSAKAVGPRCRRYSAAGIGLLTMYPRVPSVEWAMRRITEPPKIPRSGPLVDEDEAGVEARDGGPEPRQEHPHPPVVVLHQQRPDPEAQHEEGGVDGEEGAARPEGEGRPVEQEHRPAGHHRRETPHRGLVDAEGAPGGPGGCVNFC